MQIILYPDADAALINIRDTKYRGSHHLDGATLIDLDTDGNPKAIQFLNVSDGVKRQHLTGLNDQENNQVFELLRESGIEVTT